MLVRSFLVQGAAASAGVASKLASWNPSSLDGLILMSLGMDHNALVQTVRGNGSISCPVFLTETYGIIGFDEGVGKNVELMEKGRGTEYGFRGGSGGCGCLAIGYSGGAVLGSKGDCYPPNASSLMVIADQSGAWKTDGGSAPLHYGGITKTTWRLEDDGGLTQVPYFWVADEEAASTGVSTFTGEAGAATSALLAKLPPGRAASGAVGLFPCFSRGVNQYGEEHVEPTAIGATVTSTTTGTPATRVYGMFAHGELGPTEFSDFTTYEGSDSIPCTQHSGASILSIHTVPC